jgi:cysteine desulfurase/selenocysteine lyase
MNQQLRALFPITERAVYLNHAAVSPPPTPTIRAIESQLHDVSENASQNYHKWLAVREETRRLLAGLLGARADEVAFVRNTSDGLSTIANGLSWTSGDNIVTFRHEFPSNVYPWLRIRDTLGIEIRICEEHDDRIDLDELTNLIDDRTRVVAISHVQYASGLRVDLERIGRVARQHNALLVVDVIQSLGVIPIDVDAQMVDVAAAAGHKWLLTPEGIGILYLSARARELIEPTLVGWTSVPDPEDYNNFNQGWKQGALAWETGTLPTALVHGLRASLKLLTETGIETIANHLEALTDHLCAQLQCSKYELASPRKAGEKSQIVCLRHQDGLNPMSLFHHLRERSVITAPRGNRLRIAPHLYNTIDEMDELIASLP